MKARRQKLGLLALLLSAFGGTAGAAPRPELSASEVAAAPARALKQRGPSTLDSNLQRAAEKLLRGAKPVEGAIVALDPKTGRVLAWGAIAGSGSTLEVLTQARLPAASLFKVVTTTALFETTRVTPQDQVCINGGVHGIERRHLEPARGPGSQCGRFAWALGHSKNAVFAQLATRMLTREGLLKTAERLGFNAKLSLDDGELQAELGRLSVPYNDLEFARAAAGFQGSSLSPVGAAYLMTLIARGGEPVPLRLHDASAATAEDETESTRPDPSRNARAPSPSRRGR